MTDLAPIVLFVYSRPDLTLQTLESLMRNAEAADSTLYIFADGPKPNASKEQLARIEQVREVVKRKQWCKEVNYFFSEQNKGLANSVIAGVTEVVNRYGKVIVIEDDVALSPFLLRFMNDALTFYADDERVSGVGSCNYFCPPDAIGNNFMLRHPDTWAWATYARAWSLLETDANTLLKALIDKGLERHFNMENAIDLMRMLRNQRDGKVDSWAVRWTASMVLHNKLTYYPQYPLASHIGQASGTHFSGHETLVDRTDVFNKHPLSISPIEVAENPIAVQWYVKHHKQYNNLFAKAKSFLKKLSH